MLPSLTQLSIPHHTSNVVDFVTANGFKVGSLESRANNRVAFVGVRHSGNLAQFSVPEFSSTGAARLKYLGKLGECRTEHGVQLTRTFLINLHNRGKGNVHVIQGYIIGSFIV